MKQNPSPEEIQAQIYSKMSFAQKWEEVVKLRQTAWAIKAAGLRSQHPDWDEARVQDEVRRIFLQASLDNDDESLISRKQHEEKN